MRAASGRNGEETDDGVAGGKLTSKGDNSTRPEGPLYIPPSGEKLRDPIELLGCGCELEKMVPYRGAYLTFCFSLGDETGTSKVVELIEASVAIVLARRRERGIVRRNGFREDRVRGRRGRFGGGRVIGEEGIRGVWRIAKEISCV